MRDGQPFKAVLWDMDGTLVDSEPIHELSFELTAKECGFVLPADFRTATVGRSELENYKWFREQLRFDFTFDAWRAMRYRHYLENAAGLKFIAESERLWRHNEAAGISQAIVSNSDRMLLDANLSAVGLVRPGLITVTRNDVRKGKPDPEPFLRAATLLGLKPSEIAVVEDSPSGVRAGIGAGMATFFMPVLEQVPSSRARPFADLAALVGLDGLP